MTEAASALLPPISPRVFDQSRYAGFWLRFLAALIDGVVYSPLYFGMMTLLGDAHRVWAEVIFAAIALLTYAWFFSSKWQGSPGMHLLRFHICDINGRRISFLRAFAWGLTGTIGWIICFAGVIYIQTRFDIRGVQDLIQSCQEQNVSQEDCSAEVEKYITVPYANFMQLVLLSTALAFFLSIIWALSIALPKDKTGFHNILCGTRFIAGRPPLSGKETLPPILKGA